ncbi:MAG: flagellar biosynthetic protein FliO [Phaeospirillum sp.]|nr:flagellar biosynthetic protein FliO [Phaeospirillum sp.]
MEASTYLRFIFSLVLVLGMIFAAVWAVRRWGLGLMLPRPSGGKAGRRLALVEALQLDGKRRLVLIRRDDREHLLLLGGESDVVVEPDCVAPRFELPARTPETGT